jgi:peptide-methionine (S)-S-oxide reductase
LDGFAQSKKTSSKTSKSKKAATATDDTPVNEENLKTATFGSGCFWCAEAVFQQLKGVKSTVSGFSGGYVKDPTYEDVCTGATGHAEVIQIKYDPDVVKYEDLLEVFWKTHDPTTLNQQGPDFGTQYRSVIFYHDDTQKDLAEEYKKKLTAAKAFKAPIVTEISAFKEFYPADEHHQNFYRNHPDHPYCMTIIKHKVDKFRSVFKGKVDKTVNP